MTLPDWYVTSLHPAPPANPLLDWLCDQHSLTARLEAAGNCDFAVEVLYQGVKEARTDEAAALNLSSREPVWVREVLLHTRGAARVFARSVAPLRLLEQSSLDLQHLGTRSLGELLFGTSNISRGTLEISLYPAAWLPTDLRQESCWARRSLFSDGKLHLLVCEVFLPGWPPA